MNWSGTLFPSFGKIPFDAGSFFNNSPAHIVGGLLIVLLAAPVVLKADQSGDFTYSTDGTNATITGYTGPDGVVTIPDTIDGLPVRCIGEFAFDTCPGLTGIVIPDSVTTISNSAFMGCGELTNINIPRNITYIGLSVFLFCSGLQTITVDDLNPAYCSVDGVLFDKSQATLVACPPGKPGGYTIPDGVISLGVESFSFCTNLTDVTIPDSVTLIGRSAFIGCYALTNATMGDGVTNIGDSAFASGASLVRVTLGNHVVNLGDYVFESCPKLATVTIPDSVVSIGDNAFVSCTNLAAVTFGAGVTSIGNGVTGIGFGTFAADTNLVLLSLGTNLVFIGPAAFSGCTKLTSLSISNSVTAIADRVFFSCSSLTNVTIGSGVTSIGGNTFWGCASLTGITVDTNNPAYSSLAGVLFNQTQTMLVQYPEAKAGNYTIPNSVTSIGYFAFEYCWRMTNVTIPDSLTNIWDDAFVDCSNLKGIFFVGDAPNLDGTAVFASDSRATVYYLPGTTNWNATFGGLPTALWNPRAQTGDGSFGVSNNQFGFNVTGTTDLPIVVEACRNLINPTWISVKSCRLANGSVYFGDAQWTNYPSRFYRIRSP